ncbi:MAG TPA: right-handed parallel beta-helix repeat-containing protein, partial [Ilumatobacteraceae bacterium]|nr:right-handed parallel beta-helix repeat-containing protein [Ilumatobacteraceae bacterium]
MRLHIERRRPHRLTAAICVGALVIGAAACGSSDDKADTTTTASSAPSTTAATTTTTAAITLPETVPAATDTPTSPDPTTPPDDGGIINVPDDYATIQEAVDAAQPGDLVLIAPGNYNEAVTVTTPELTIRGLDRNEVVLDGEFTLDNGIRVVGANGVAVENMTARNYTRNGFFWTGVTGYRGSYLTAFRNGDYGLYAFLSTSGQFDHSYGAGSPDAGFYIGGCFPCDAVLSEYNGLGYSGTNSGGDLYIVNSIFRYNRAGIVPNSGSYEPCYPERNTTIVGNLVYSNNQPDTPAIDVALLAMGNGILSAGGVGNVIERNLVYDHDKTGIGLVPFLEEDPNDDQPAPDEWETPCAETLDDPLPDPATVPDVVLWDSHDNTVRDNVLEDNRVADIAVDSAGSDLSGLGNCFSGNTHTTSAPTALETLAPCGGTGSGDWTAGGL